MCESTANLKKNPLNWTFTLQLSLMHSINCLSFERSLYTPEKKNVFSKKTAEMNLCKKRHLAGTCRKRHFSHHKCSKWLKPPKKILALELVLRMPPFCCENTRSCSKIAIRSKKAMSSRQLFYATAHLFQDASTAWAVSCLQTRTHDACQGRQARSPRSGCNGIL